MHIKKKSVFAVKVDISDNTDTVLKKINQKHQLNIIKTEEKNPFDLD